MPEEHTSLLVTISKGFGLTMEHDAVAAVS